MKYLLSSVLALAAIVAFGDDVIWQTHWMPEGFGDPVPSTYLDVIPSGDGGAFASVMLFDINPKGPSQRAGRVVRFSTTGGILWQTGFIDGTYSVMGLDASGNLYVTVKRLYHEPDGYTRKFSPSGIELWSRWNFERFHWSTDMLVEPNGDQYVSGASWDDEGIIAKFGTNGALQWQRNAFLGSQADPFLKRDADGNVAIFQAQKMAVYDSAGNVVRSLTAPHATGEWVTAFGMDNEVYLGTPAAGMVRRFNEDASLVWTRSFPDIVQSVNCDGSQVYVTTRASAHRLDLAGNELWTGALTSSSAPYGSSVDGIGNWLTHRSQAGQLARLKGNAAISAFIGALPNSRLAVGELSDMFLLEQDAPTDPVRLTRYHNGVDHDSADLIRGRTTEHSRLAMMHSGDGYWSIAPGPVLSNQQAPVSIVVKHTAPTVNPAQMGVILESRANVSGVKQSVEVYNFSTSTWTGLESNVVLPAGGSPDRYVIVPIPSPANFIGPGREIRLRLEYRVDTPVLVWPWTARIDREMIRYVK